MAFDKKDFNKRKYNYRYRPFFWSIHIKPSATTNVAESTGSSTCLSEDDS